MDISSDLDDFESYPVVDLDSDCGGGTDSSDDEVGVILHGTPQQKRRFYRRSLGHDSSSEDDFEKEMEAELTQTMHSLENRFNQASKSVKAGSEGGCKKRECYAQEYFDSSSDEEMSSKDKSAEKHRVISNDDLLYDPHLDDDDQRWVDAQRSRCQPAAAMTTGGGRKRKAGSISKLANSDAVLNCPACMCLLCRDCQRHSIYNNQYRAMFVTNCCVDASETLKYPLKQQQKGGKSKKAKKKDKQKLKHQQQMQRAQEENHAHSGPAVNNMDAEVLAADKQIEKGRGKRSAENSSSVSKMDSEEVLLPNRDDKSVTDTIEMDQNSTTTTSVQSLTASHTNACDHSAAQAVLDQSTAAAAASMRDGGGSEEADYECYHPVKCSECTTVVGVIDNDQIVHFFNVLASY